MCGWGSGAAVAAIAVSVKVVGVYDNTEHVVERYRYRNYGDNNKADNEFGWNFAWRIAVSCHVGYYVERYTWDKACKKASNLIKINSTKYCVTANQKR